MEERKKLWIPIITPLKRLGLHEGQLEKTELCGRKGSDTHFICTETLINLLKSISPYCDAILPGWTTGEGSYLKPGLWRNLVECCYLYGSQMPGQAVDIIPGILFKNKNEVKDAIRWIIKKMAWENQVVGFGILAQSLIGKNSLLSVDELKEIVEIEKERYETEDSKPYQKPFIHLYLERGVALNNKDIIEYLNNAPQYFASIKDARFNELNLEIKIKDLAKKVKGLNLENPIHVFQGWENMFPRTSEDVKGGVFALGNIEPRIMRNYLDGNHLDECRDGKPIADYIVSSLYHKFASGYKWITKIKREFYSRPFSFDYNSLDFNKAFDKMFRFYAEEPVKNIHVEKFDPLNPLSSIIRTFFSDLLSLQLNYFRYNDLDGKKSGYRVERLKSELLFLPVEISVTDHSNEHEVKHAHFYNPTSENKKDLEHVIKQFVTEPDEKSANHLFFNNYEVEKAIFHSQKPSDYHPNFNPLFTDKTGPAPWKSGNRFSKITNLYESQDRSTVVTMTCSYWVNANQNKEKIKVPDFIFKNLFRTAVFTKRNRLATKLIEESSKRQAVSQILARNFSHNIGSHVLNRSKVSNIKRRILELAGEDNIDNATLIDFIANLKSQLDEYIIRRNDFLAYPIRPVKNMMFLRDVFFPFIENTLILDNIAKSEAVGFESNQYSNLYLYLYKDQKKITADYKSVAPVNPGKSVFLPVSYPNDMAYYFKLNNENDVPYSSKYQNPEQKYQEYYQSREIKGAEDFIVTIPDEHAFYSILENIIRNSAKHNYLKNEKGIDESSGLKINIEIKTEDARFYRVEIWDEASKVTDEKFKDLQSMTQVDLTDSNYEPTQKYLGFLDMRINASLLAGNKRITSLNEEDFFLEKIKEDEEYYHPDSGEQQFRFKTIIKLAKPSIICYIGKSPELLQHENIAKDKGIWIFSGISDLLTELEGKNLCFEFSIVEEEILQNLSHEDIDKLVNWLPNRIMVITEHSEFEILNLERQNVWEYYRLKFFHIPTNPLLDEEGKFTLTQDVLEKCWSHWVKKYENTKLVLFSFRKIEEYFDHPVFQNSQFTYFWEDYPKKIQPFDPEKNEYVFWSHHGGGLQKKNTGEKYYSGGFLGKHSFNRFEKNTWDFSLIDNPNHPTLPYELLESGSMDILIWDERILEHSYEKNNKGDDLRGLGFGFKGRTYRNWDYCWASNTRICTHFAVSCPNKDEEKQPTWKFVRPGLFEAETDQKFKLNFILNEDKIDDIRYTCNFHERNAQTSQFEVEGSYIEAFAPSVIIIHRTFLSKEKLNGMTPQNFLSELRKFFPIVLVISGGGIPHNLPKELFKFINYHELKYYFSEFVSKLHLTKRIHTLTD